MAAMTDRLEDDIFTTGWCPEVEAALTALEWATSDSPVMIESMAKRLEGYLAIPPATRRQEWINRGGDPASWPKTP
jgi:hypothetical protein